MTEQIFKIDGYDFNFRIKRINAIELLALRTQINFDNIKKTKELFGAMLEKIEVQCGENWLPCKMEGREVYSPAGLEDDVFLAEGLVDYFLNDFLKPVFQKSNVSKA